VILITSACPAYGSASHSGSSLSAFGLTDEKFESSIKGYLNIPYRKGGASEKGMDCSGFVRTVYNRFFDIKLPYNAQAQFGFSDLEKIDPLDMQPGDLIFFTNNKKKKRITHVGVYISGRQFIHASSSQGVTVSSLDNRYWKKRFVGSKRHMILNANPDSDKIRVESALAIPVHENGMIRSYTRNDFHFNGLAVQNDVSPFDHTPFETHGLNYPSLSFYEIRYDHTLFDGFNVNLSASHERFDPLTAWPGFDFTARDTDYLPDASLPDPANRLGFKLASAFQPSNWFSITPSITFFDYSNENEDLLNAPQWTFGVNTLLSPINKQWSLSMLLQYSESDDLATAKSSYTRFSTLDLGIKLWFHLTDNLQFSIMGNHDIQTSAHGLQTDSLFMQSSSSNVFMMFDFSY